MIMRQSIDAFLAKDSRVLGSGSWSIRILKSGSTRKALPLYGVQEKVVLIQFENRVIEANE